MLDELRRSYEQHADLYVPGWRKMSKNELCNKYIESGTETPSYVECKGNTIQSAYLSAIIAKYWSSLNRCYAKVGATASAEDCYGMLLDAIFYTLKTKPWVTLGNKLYKDPFGPDKSVNVNLSSSISGYFQFSNCQKRKANAAAISVEYLKEECGDAAFKDTAIEPDEDSGIVDSLVIKNFNSMNYIASFAIDGAVNGGCFKYSHDDKGYLVSEFSRRLLNKHIRELDPEYLHEFSNRYRIDFKKVRDAAKICSDTPSGRVDSIVKRTFNDLKHSKYFAGEQC